MRLDWNRKALAPVEPTHSGANNSLRMDYPPARLRCACRPEVLSDRFPRHEATQGFVATTNTLANIIVFSGTPDRVEIWVETNDVILALTDLLTREEARITIRAGQYWEPAIPCGRVQAVNAVAGFNGRIQVVGKWAAR